MIDELDVNVGSSLYQVESDLTADECCCECQGILKARTFSIDLSTMRRKGEVHPHAYKKNDEIVALTAMTTIELQEKATSAQLDLKNRSVSYKPEGLSGYLLGIGEMILGGTLMATGALIEVGSFGTLTIAVGLQESAGFALLTDGFARTLRSGKDLSFDQKFPPTWKSSDITFNWPLNKSGSVDPSLPANPDDLLKQPGWKETTHPEAEKHGHRMFDNEITGEKLRHDDAKPGEYGHKAHDHYHRPNPNKSSWLNEYLDGEGNPVPDGHDKSHIYSPEKAWW